MKAKYKMTGCARFLIFLVFLIPIAYFGSKYLRDSGTWDKIKEKVENTDSNSVEEAIQRRTPIDVPANGNISDQQIEDLRNGYREQERIIAEYEDQIKNLRKENADLRERINANGGTTSPVGRDNTEVVNEPATSSNDGSPSLDELLSEADKNVGNPENTSSRTTANQESLGSWNFNYSGTSGTIEFFRQNGRLYSRISANGDSRSSIDELTVSGERFGVVNSPAGEYYILLSNGNLEAYDRNGYQTTCTRNR